MTTYDFLSIEKKWQLFWSDNEIYKAEKKSNKPKYYVLDMFPYPSGIGLHVGHLKGYVASDVISRYKRMQGFSVLHPMGWDAFGLPAERQAVKENKHPGEITARNTSYFKQQLQQVGLSYDWEREFATTDPDYYKWTQFLFKKMYEKGLAYQDDVPVNWCPALGTVLANEEVKDGFYVETGDPVEKRFMKQWMLRITDYADRLIDDLDLVDWPEGVKEMQRQWIGKAAGTRVRFNIRDQNNAFHIFTTRADTLFGCSFCVLAPEHPLLKEIVTKAQKEAVDEYIAWASNRSDRDRISDINNKTGVFTGAYAINPVSGKEVPIWISDYVLMSFGDGAVFACPAHDQRDYDFARHFDLPIVEVISGGDISKEAYTSDGPHINSEFLNGLNIEDAKQKINDYLESKDLGSKHITYRLKDWLFSRQRYWGEPFPFLMDEAGNVSVVADDELPVILPQLDAYQTKNELAPLASAVDWVNVVNPQSGKNYQREVNTMPQWAGSSWYFLRFCDPNNTSAPWGNAEEKYWMPVDLYIGGVEHATLHLLYARFWHKFFYDIGLVSSAEPFKKLFNQGMITAQSYQDERGRYYYPEQVEQKGKKWFSKEDDSPIQVKVEKMSKSKHNGVSPDDVINQYGADTLRVYEMFLGPVEKGGLWQTENIVGSYRFLEKVNRIYTNVSISKSISDKLDRLIHKTVKKVTDDMEALNLNTAISQLMVLASEMSRSNGLTSKACSIFARLIAPYAPHIAEECWLIAGGKGSVHLAPWPTYDTEKVLDETVTISIQVNGKVRSIIDVPKGSEKSIVEKNARQDSRIVKYLADNIVVKVIYVPNKILNFVVKK